MKEAVYPHSTNWPILGAKSITGQLRLFIAQVIDALTPGLNPGVH